MRFIKTAALCALALWLTACASTPRGMAMRLDYRSEAAAAQTDARLRDELSLDEQRQFYQAVIFLCVADLRAVGGREASRFLAALQNAGDAPFRSAPAVAEGAQMRALMQERFGGKTPRQVIAEARRLNGFDSAEKNLRFMTDFLRGVETFMPQAR